MVMVDERPGGGPPMDWGGDPGEWLVLHRKEMDCGESAWLDALGEFDRDQLWALDGQLSCREWLTWKTGMARSTAYERVRIARELRGRPIVREAFAAGQLSFSAVRIITRLDHPTEGVDRAMVDLAVRGGISDLERMARFYELHASQDRPPPELRYRRGLTIKDRGDGTSQVTIILGATEAAELEAALNAFIDRSATGQSPAGDNQEAPMESSPWPSRRADAFVDLVRTGRDHAGEGYSGGADRYLVHIVERDGHAQLLDGTPLEPAAAARVGCDSATVRHTVDDSGGPLALSRKTKQWSTAQRRAIAVRDRGHCRFPGCERRYVDVHHVRWWERGGPTDVSNGMQICPRHHTLLHEGGYEAVGDTNQEVQFYRPDGTWLGSTSPC